MDKTNSFQVREAAFEARYFQNKNAQLVDNLRKVFQQKVDKDSIREATGVADEQVLDRLVELNLSGELMSAFKLLPFVEVAWANGAPDNLTRRAVLQAAEQQGIAAGTKAYAMLEYRLSEKPSTDFRKIWFLYAETLKKTLTPEQLATFRKDTLDLCHRIAEASGGILNMVLKTSANEKAVIAAVEKALT